MICRAELFVGVGAGVGAVARYSVGLAMAKVNQSPFPWATWLINLIGTLLLAIFVQTFTVHHQDPNWWLVLGEGFCGGFTTFSTMSVETIRLFRTDWLVGVVYIGSSLALGLFLAWMIQFWI
ncbi:fluoride efflux transporter CrcB [Alicyclobacillus acidiphilus]|uniref:fluoride efflux transporter CrcB n=1 Tax=Alicyclobacillus acidiphilus TaxID=182455 RepID=UPI000835123F|nr:fluoride efflux transporter CrcB [Alicyclobacillus acidiphilus]